MCDAPRMAMDPDVSREIGEQKAMTARLQADLSAMKQEYAQTAHMLRSYMPTVISAAVPQGRLGDQPPLFKKVGVLGFLMGDGDGTGAGGAFNLTTSSSGGNKYTIGRGSITDGTNGAAIDLTGVIETPKPASEGYVVIQATIDPDTLVATDWEAAIVSDSEAAEEVELSGSPIGQVRARLLIGKITITSGNPVATQSIFTSARITHGLLNGVAVKVFEAAPTHPTTLSLS